MVVGDPLIIKLTGEQTGGQYSMSEVHVSPGGGAPPHIHRREDESFYILEGELTFYVDGREIAARVGDLVFGPKDVSHYYVNRGAAQARFLVTSTPAGMEHFFAAISRPEGAPPGPPDAAEIAHIIATAAKFGLEILPPPGA